MRGIAKTCALATVSWALGTVVAPCDAYADPPAPSVEAAHKHFEAGARAYAAGDFTRAGEEFEAANAEQPHADSLYNAARSWEHAGDLARAANLYRAYLRAASSSDADRSRAEASLVTLTTRVGGISLVLRGVTDVTVDGRAVAGFDASDAFAYVLPGEHVAAGLDDQKVSVSRVVKVAAGANVSVVLEKEPPVVAQPDPPKPPIPDPPLTIKPAEPVVAKPSDVVPPPERHGAPAWVAIGLGSLTAVSASLMIASGVDVLKAKSDYEDLKKDATPDEQQGLIDEGVYRTDRTNVLIGVTAALGIGTGVALVFTDFGPRAPKVQAGPLGARVTGTF